MLGAITGILKKLTVAVEVLPALPFTSCRQLISAAVCDPWQRLIHSFLGTAAWGSKYFPGLLEGGQALPTAVPEIWISTSCKGVKRANRCLVISVPVRTLSQSCNSILTRTIVTSPTDNGPGMSGNSVSEFIRENVFGLLLTVKNKDFAS